MIEFYKLLWPILTLRTRRRLVVAAVLMAGVAVLEGIGLLLMIPLLQLLTSADFSATSDVITLAADLFGRQGSDLAAELAVIVLVVYVVKGLGAVAILRWAATFAMEEEVHLVTRLMTVYLAAPLDVHFHRNSADFQRTVNQSVRALFSQAFVSAFSSLGDLLGVGLIAVILVASAPALTLVGLAYFAVVLGVYQRVVNRGMHIASAHVHRDQMQVFRDVQQALGAVKEVKAGAVEAHFVDAIRRSRHAMLRSYRTLALAQVQPRYVLELTMIGAAATVSIFAYSTQSTAGATASIAIFLAGGFRMLAPMTKVANGLNQVKVSKPAILQIAADLRDVEPRSQRELASSPIHLDLRPRVELRGVSFAYDEDRPVLRNLHLEIEPGESVALIGGSGAGKSTVVDLVLGLLEPTAGAILIDGRPLLDVRRAWQRQVGYVPQAISLLDASIRDNVLFGWDDGTGQGDESIWGVLADAQMTEVVQSLPHGLDTAIGEHGVRLSGGQRQRLGIARALYRRPTLLVLDEATSALDNETEAQFIEVLHRLQGRLTILAIAHRLTTVRDVNRAYYLAAGSVVDSGTFDELARRIPEFAHLVELSTIE